MESLEPENRRFPVKEVIWGIVIFLTFAIPFAILLYLLWGVLNTYIAPEDDPTQRKDLVQAFAVIVGGIVAFLTLLIGWLTLRHNQRTLLVNQRNIQKALSNAQEVERYARVYERRAKVVDELYKLVIKAEASVPRAYPSKMMITVAADPGQLRMQAREFLTTIGEISQYYKENALWFDHSTEKVIQQFLKECITAVSEAITLTHPDIKLWYEFIDQPPVLSSEASVAYLQERIERIDRISDHPGRQRLHADSYDEHQNKAEEIVESFRRVRNALEAEFRRNLNG